MGMEGRQHYDTALHQLVTVDLVIGVSSCDYNVPPKAMAELNCVKWLNGGQVFITNSIGGLLFNCEMALVAQFQVCEKGRLVVVCEADL